MEEIIDEYRSFPNQINPRTEGRQTTKQIKITFSQKVSCRAMQEGKQVNIE